MNEKTSIKHISKEEDYAYASGLLKAREDSFFSIEDLNSLYGLTTMNEVVQHLEGKRYMFKKKMEDYLDFENFLMERYLEEIKGIAEILPEEYPLCILSLIQFVIYKNKFALLDASSSENFKNNLQKLSNVAKNGTDYTKEVASYFVDRFNIMEQLRSFLNKEKCNIYYQAGNISLESLESLFASLFSEIPHEIENSYWRNFFYENLPLRIVNFKLTFNFERYWLKLLKLLADKKKEEPYGLNYIISYFLRFLLEVLNLQRIALFVCYKINMSYGEFS